MKRSLIIVLIMLAILSIGVIVFAIVLLNQVLGDKLFYLNSSFGLFCARTYRWFGLAAIFIIIVWICFAAIKFKKIRTWFAERSKACAVRNQEIADMATQNLIPPQTSAVPTVPTNAPVYIAPTITPVAPTAPSDSASEQTCVFCVECGALLKAGSRFCMMCGRNVTDV